ncbi:MAG: hypothetical protein RLZZ324_1031, partial [Candidatus Parcubacteria bacterium]
AGKGTEESLTSIYHRHYLHAPFKTYADGAFGVSKEYFRNDYGHVVIPNCVALRGDNLPGTTWSSGDIILSNRDAITGVHDGYLSAVLPAIPQGVHRLNAVIVRCPGSNYQDPTLGTWDTFGQEYMIAQWLRMPAADRKFVGCNYLDTVHQQCVPQVNPACDGYVTGDGTNVVTAGGTMDQLTSTMSGCATY